MTPSLSCDKLFLTLVLSSVIAVVAGQASDPPTFLEAGAPIDRSIAGGETHAYRFSLKAGEFAQVIVEQRGVDVVVEIRRSGGQLVVQVDDAAGPQGNEQVDCAVETDTTYTVSVHPLMHSAAAGGYRISIGGVRAATDRDRSLFEAQRLRTVGGQHMRVDDYGQALPAYQGALQIAEKLFGPDDLYTLSIVEDLATVHLYKNDDDQALSLYRRAYDGLRAKLGDEDLKTAIAESRLGAACMESDAQADADRYLNHALEIEQRTLEPDDLWTAKTVFSLGLSHWLRRDYVDAEREYRQALTGFQKAGDRDLDVAAVLNAFGALRSNQGDYDGAEPFFTQSLAIAEGILGPRHSSLTFKLNNLGVVENQRKHYSSARQYYSRALGVVEHETGVDDPFYAVILGNIANTYRGEGDNAKALELHLKALDIFERKAGVNQRQGSLANVAAIYAAAGEIENAVRAESRMDALLEQGLAYNIAIGSERQKLAYLSSIGERTNRTLSLHLRLAHENPDAARLAALVLLQRKGRVLDTVAGMAAVLRARADPADQQLLDQQQKTSVELATLALNGPQKQSPDRYAANLRELTERKEKLESAISEHNSSFRELWRPVTLESVQAALPADAALLEFTTYRPFDFRTGIDAEQLGSPHYAVYIVRREGAPIGLDLGEASQIDASVSRLREMLRDPRRDVASASRDLFTRIMKPVEPELSHVRRLLISPDGELDLLPFESLLDRDGRYLFQRYFVTYLSTGRDLLRMQLARASRSEPVIVADPVFGEPRETRAAATALLKATTAPRRSVTTAKDLRDVYFAPLTNTAVEARNIKSMFPSAALLVRSQASKAALEELSAPQILHIATHGFFLEDENPKAPGSPESALLRAGLALSGANVEKGGRRDGILTALEASGLDLWGTKLVTLSACDTGLGAIKTGEGVYGLRRAFFLAGAETLVMSLWPVSDFVTREMMKDYYSGLKAGLGRGDALHEAQLRMLNRPNRRHPFYWAGFIQAGDWRPLSGGR
jgi:CHAT domain-containing protein